MSHTVEPMDTRTVYGRPGHATVVENDAEWHAVAHVRGWCHDGTKCPLCTAQNRAFTATQEARQRAIRAEATALTATQRRIRADIATAEMARDLIAAEDRAERAEATLNSIIEG